MNAVSDDGEGRSMDEGAFEQLERATGIEGFKLDDDSRHRIEWALFWARHYGGSAKGCSYCGSA